MKKCISVLILFLIYSCAVQSAVKNDAPISPKPELLSEIPARTSEESALSPIADIKPLYGKLLSNIKISKTSFNPQYGQRVDISFHLSKPAKVTTHVYDPDWELVKTIVDDKNLVQGEQIVSWNGKDMDGNVMPDEAYFCTITAEDKTGTKEIYDPTTFTGGIEHDITSADISPENGTLIYKMPEMGRVLIRTGIEGGPLLNTVVDWKPRIKGMVTEYWNGKDKDNLVDLYNHPKFKMLITYFSLPDNSVISYGNKRIEYRDYKRSLIVQRPAKKKRASPASKTSQHYRLSRTVDYSPDVKIDFINTQGTDSDGTTIILKGKTIVKVELDEQDKVIFQNQQFEIVFFLDNEFYAEDEAGYTPFNWVWDLSNVEEGEHLLTVNLSSFKDQIGILSRKVRVVK